MGIVSQPEGKVHEIPEDKQDGAIFVISFPEVMNVGEKDGLLLRASRLFDLPADALAGAPRVEVVGDGELHISGGSMVILVRGAGLELRAMTPEELLITGTITAVEFMR